ncbi:MAG: HNH endonuclease [Treponema sp.]|nr:HNH endonuclease [Treponema sp.]MBR1404992.1 HNH endonuclease [Treponema sp.]
MKILDENWDVKEIYDSVITVPDCFVVNKNQLGTGHGEAKLYIGSKEAMRNFFGSEGFSAKCFMLKKDLLDYLTAVKSEYFSPSQNYVGKNTFKDLWNERVVLVNNLDDIIWFEANDQTQIRGPRGYVNSTDDGYKIIRTLALPLISYISSMMLVRPNNEIVFYWKLFVDFDAIAEKKNGPLVFNYGKKTLDENGEVVEERKNQKLSEESNNARQGQGKFRDKLLEECPFCPITMCTEEKLLIASHIKPWAVSNEKEKIDPKNGFMLSPLYDKLFDKGFITFTNDKHMILSNWISNKNYERLGVVNNSYYQMLPIDDKRIEYLEYHRTSVFKG